MEIRKPPKLSKERVIGPLRQQTGWEAGKKAAEVAWESAFGDEDEKFHARLDDAYASFANCAEKAVAEATGVEIAKPGCRAKKPRAVWHSVLPEKVKEESYPTSGVLHALRSAICQGKRVIGPPRAVEDDMAILEATLNAVDLVGELGGEC